MSEVIILNTDKVILERMFNKSRYSYLETDDGRYFAIIPDVPYNIRDLVLRPFNKSDLSVGESAYLDYFYIVDLSKSLMDNNFWKLIMNKENKVASPKNVVYKSNWTTGMDGWRASSGSTMTNEIGKLKSTNVKDMTGDGSIVFAPTSEPNVLTKGKGKLIYFKLSGNYKLHDLFIRYLDNDNKIVLERMFKNSQYSYLEMGNGRFFAIIPDVPYNIRDLVLRPFNKSDLSVGESAYLDYFYIVDPSLRKPLMENTLSLEKE